ncbi:MAG: hypothetical protein KGJ43_00270, partial [Acidobacteriota bacterium]|nr:hypothetical protein [Acidobacteriota bacterium]
MRTTSWTVVQRARGRRGRRHTGSVSGGALCAACGRLPAAAPVVLGALLALAAGGCGGGSPGAP